MVDIFGQLKCLSIIWVILKGIYRLIFLLWSSEHGRVGARNFPLKSLYILKISGKFNTLELWMAHNFLLFFCRSILALFMVIFNTLHRLWKILERFYYPYPHNRWLEIMYLSMDIIINCQKTNVLILSKNYNIILYYISFLDVDIKKNLLFPLAVNKAYVKAPP